VQFALPGVGGEFGLGGAQQPDLGGDLSGQAGEAGGGVAVVEVQRGPGGIEPLACPPGALMVVRGVGDHRCQPGQAQPEQGAGAGVAFQDRQACGAEVAGERADRQQLAGQVLDPDLAFGGFAGEPVGGPHPPVQRGPHGPPQSGSRRHLPDRPG
jgi:hypothetical protein